MTPVTAGLVLPNMLGLLLLRSQQWNVRIDATVLVDYLSMPVLLAFGRPIRRPAIHWAGKE